MQFRTLVALAAALFVGAAQAEYNPIGQSCSAGGTYGCANDVSSINGGNAFIYVCNGSTFQLSALCGGKTSCVATTSGAYCT
ncbi:hypothetical protein BDZ89DRAFT_1058225 [Hymenopellis radicata]|nr:hypothetical protein BDZ89DRAFT_1058225 [Hymenopellis radicata]